jgi:3-hydroxyacyl-CoA dehydrogenase/enoyl-CoA hydratase/3-hydroxybutyryl-CoA epimerase
MQSTFETVFAAKRLELGPEPAGAGPWSHWRLTRDEEGTAWLILDKKGASANTLGSDVLVEFEAVLTELERQPPKGLVLRSGKASGFIAGADITEFETIKDAALFEKELARAHALLDRLERLHFPTLAVIHGFCLGGGLELALACKRRIAIAGARLGFPEIMLGLHPGFGGTARATHRIDPVAAMTMMLTGKSAEARKAKALGLVDAVTEERHVREAVRSAMTGKLHTSRHWLGIALMNSRLGRHFLGGRMFKETQRKVMAEHYPAPAALIELWEQHGGRRAAMLAAERSSFAKLIVGETSRNLVRVYFLRERLKKLAGRNTIGHVHVVGAGAMGGDIAAWAAWQGMKVTLQDTRSEPVAAAVKRAADLYGKLTRRPIEVRDALDRLVPDMRGNGVTQADLVIEAVSEKAEVKRQVYASLEPRMKPGALLATNTSSIPLEELVGGLQRPERLVGLHFFNPVSRMQLVEIVSHDGLASEAQAAATAFVGAIDRLAVPVKSAPGFVVNRALMPYLGEAMLMLGEGIRPEAIDDAARRFGMPVGPIELADEVGLDVCLGVADVLGAKLKRAMPKLPDWLRKKVEAGDLGRKSGKGLYVWKSGKPQKATESFAPLDAQTTDRLILPILDACVACLREGVVADTDLIDAALIFGAGFAPFRGGPMHYAKTRGVAEIVATMNGLAGKFGERFAPDAGWDRV